MFIVIPGFQTLSKRLFSLPLSIVWGFGRSIRLFGRPCCSAADLVLLDQNAFRMLFRKLTSAQEECLQKASNQPVGRKGPKWLAWANRVLRAGGLPEVEVLESPVSDPAPPPQVSGLQKPRMRVQNGAQQAPAQGLQATLQLLNGQQNTNSSIQIPCTFVVQSGVLEGPGVSITIEKGTLKGYFLVSGVVSCCLACHVCCCC
jgi:hypothetical protein